MALQNVQDAIIITTANPLDNSGPEIVYVNPAFERMTGYKASEVLGKTPRILQSPGTDRASLDRVRAALTAHSPVREIILNNRKDGTHFWVEMDIKPIVDDGGGCTHYIAVQREVRDPQNHELVIPEVVNRLQGIVFTFRLFSDGRSCVPFASEGITRIFGLSPEEVRADASSFYSKVHPDDLPTLKSEIERSANGLTMYQGSFRAIAVDGRARRLHATASPVREADGSTFWHGYISDLGSAIEFPNYDLQTVIDAIPVGIFIKDASSRFVLMNAACEEQFGVSLSDLRGTDGSTVFTADQVAGFNATDRAALEGRHAIDFEEKHLNASLNGSRVSRTFKKPIFDREGNPLYIVGVSLDITAQKDAENSRRASEEKLRNLFELSDVGFVLGAMDGRYLEFNEAFRKMLGYSRDELLAMRYQDITPPEFQASDQIQLERMLASRNYPAREKEYIRKDGSRVSVQIRGAVIEGSDGQLYRWAIVEDITERKRQYEAQAYLAAIVESSADAILSLDRDGKIIAWNTAAETMFGYSSAEIVGRQCSILVPSHMMADFEINLANILVGDRIDQFPSVRKRKNGEEFPVLLTLAPMRDGSGNVFGGSVTVRDITQQNLLEERLRQSQKMEAIGNLTGGLAHDFNNLLSVILGNMEILAESPGRPTADIEIFEDIITAAKQGAELTKSLLAFARRQPLQQRVLNMNTLIDDVVKMLERLLSGDIEILVEHEENICAVLADAALLSAAITNLATNARDAMPTGGTLTISTKHRVVAEDNHFINLDVPPGDYAVIEVSDTGRGIPASMISQIFEPFFTTKERDRGTGLGLSMVFGFVKQSGGHINVYSEEGRGTTFRLYLPCQQLVESNAAPIDASGDYLGRGAQVLLVEDNIALRRLITRQLDDLGYVVHEAGSGLEALAILRSMPVDLVFSDVVMPGGMDGYQLAVEVKSNWPTVKIVLTSGFPERRSAEQDSEPRIRLLTKPYLRHDLAKLLWEVLNGSDDLPIDHGRV